MFCCSQVKFSFLGSSLNNITMLHKKKAAVRTHPSQIGRRRGEQLLKREIRCNGFAVLRRISR